MRWSLSRQGGGRVRTSVTHSLHKTSLGNSRLYLAALTQQKQDGGGKELAGCELSARTAAFTLLPFVSPV